MSNFKHPATIYSTRLLLLLSEVRDSQKLPYQNGFKQLQKNTPLTFKPTVIPNVYLGPYGIGSIGHNEFTGNATMSLQQVLMFIATKEEGYAKNAVNIIWQWSKGCLTITGSNTPLECGWANIMIRAAEILKYKYPKGWTTTVNDDFVKYLDRIFLPNLTGKRYIEIFRYNNNWTITINEALLQIALFKEDKVSFLYYIEEYKKILVNCIMPTGQLQETKRDMWHSQAGIASFIQCAELCYQQGIDIYSCNNNLLKTCMEYHAKIISNNGNPPPPDFPKDKLPIKDIYFFRCVWEVGYNHYANRKNIDMPETKALLIRYRPEQAVFNWGVGWLHYYSF
jgi:hypothetical protein